MDSMFIINIAIGAYALYSAITGKGHIYKNDFPEEIQEGSNKLLRIVCWIIGPIMLAQGALDYFKYWSISNYLIIPVVLVIVAYLIIFKIKFGKIVKEHRNKSKF